MSFESAMTVAINKINENTSKTKADVETLMQWRAGVEERCKNHLSLTTEVRETLYGEKTGLKSRMQRVENCKTAVKNTKVLWQGFYMYLLKVLVAAGLLAAIAIVFKMWKHLG